MAQFDIQAFEEASRQNGERYWLAHELMTSLGYESWLSFLNVITRAQAACARLGIDVTDAFRADEGEVAGKTCVLIDDMVDTAGTLCIAAQALKDGTLDGARTLAGAAVKQSVDTATGAFKAAAGLPAKAARAAGAAGAKAAKATQAKPAPARRAPRKR
jgi:hypothetical protein